jgi:hypothetical protein
MTARHVHQLYLEWIERIRNKPNKSAREKVDLVGGTVALNRQDELMPDFGKFSMRLLAPHYGQLMEIVFRSNLGHLFLLRMLCYYLGLRRAAALLEAVANNESTNILFCIFIWHIIPFLCNLS